MIPNYLYVAIIATARVILPTLALLAFTPWLIHSAFIQQWQQSLVKLQPWCLAFHGLFYFALVVLWPGLIKRLQAQNPQSPEQIKTALKLRWYLLAIFLFIDALMLWRMR